LDARKNFTSPTEELQVQDDEENILFDDFMEQWLEMMKHRVIGPSDEQLPEFIEHIKRFPSCPSGQIRNLLWLG
jgi:hypothetical protein